MKRFDRLLDLAFLAEYAVRKRSPDQEKWLRRQIEKIARHMRLPLKLKTADASEDNQRRCEDSEGSLEGLSAAGTTRRLIGDAAMRPAQAWRMKTGFIATFGTGAYKSARSDEITLSVDDDRNERDLLVEARAKLITRGGALASLH